MLVGPNWRSLDDANQIGLTTQANRPVPYHLGLWEWRWSTLSCFETSQLWLILLAVPTSFRSLFGFICCLCLVLLLSSFWDCFVSMFVLGFLIPVCFCSRILDFPSLFSAISVHFWILSHVCRFSFCKYPCLFSDFHQNLISFLHIFPWLDWLESLCQESKIENLKLKRGWGRAQHLPHQTHDHRCLIFYLFVSCFLPIMIMLKRICLCVCVFLLLLLLLLVLVVLLFLTLLFMSLFLLFVLGVLFVLVLVVVGVLVALVVLIVPVLAVLVVFVVLVVLVLGVLVLVTVIALVGANLIVAGWVSFLLILLSSSSLMSSWNMQQIGLTNRYSSTSA